MTLYGFGAPGCDDRGGADRREQFVIPTADINKTTMITRPIRFLNG
jgi:hypothetical protein